MFYALLLMLPVLLVLSAAASGSETALFSLSSHERSELCKRHPAVGKMVERLLSQPRLLLVQVLVLNMTVNVLYFVASTLLTSRAPNPGVGVAVSFGTVLGLVLLGEVLAKVLAGVRAAEVSALVAGPLLVIRRLMWPLLLTLDRYVVAPLARLVHPGGETEGLQHEELTQLLQGAGGHLTEAERTLLSDVVELRLRRARDVMTPRVDLKPIESNWTADRVRESEQAFVPISDDGLMEDVKGTIDVRRALLGDHAGAVLPPAFVPEMSRLDQLLEEFGRRSVDLAYCVDERGEITGMVTLEDVVDELTAGVSAAEGGATEARLVELGVWRVPGRLSVRDFAELFGVEDSDEWKETTRVSTVGGLVQARLGRIPTRGEQVLFGGFRFVVRQMVGRAVRLVDVSPIEHEASDDD